MIKHIIALSIATSLMACSGDSNDTPATTAGGTTTSTGSTGGDTTGGGSTGGGNTSGDLPGVWFGQNNVGDTVMVIDSSQNVYSLSTNGDNHEAVLGTVAGPQNRYLHLPSSNSDFGDSFRLVGDLPTTDGSGDTVSYNLAVSNEGQQLDNTGSTPFSLTYAGTNDIEAITLASVAGSYEAKTSFCVSPPAAAACDLLLAMNVSADGSVSGRTEYNGANVIDITGTASEGNGQYLNVSYSWNGIAYSGVLYQDRTTSKLVLNSYVPSDPAQKTITGKMTKQ